MSANARQSLAWRGLLVDVQRSKPAIERMDSVLRRLERTEDQDFNWLASALRRYIAGADSVLCGLTDSEWRRLAMAERNVALRRAYSEAGSLGALLNAIQARSDGASINPAVAKALDAAERAAPLPTSKSQLARIVSSEGLE